MSRYQPIKLPEVIVSICRSDEKKDRLSHDISRSMEAVFDCLMLNGADVARCVEGAIELLRCELAERVKFLTAMAVMPSVQDRAISFFRSKGIPPWDAEDLGGELGVRIVKFLSGRWPRGNFGAWVAKTTRNLAYDYFRKVRLVRRKLGKRRSEAHLYNCPGPEETWEALDQDLNELPKETREIIQRRRDGQTWPQIAVDLGKSEKELRRQVQRDWPGGCSPLSRNPRRIKRSSWR
jgi:RNA polymerase sigma factor (sigma-70 family)